MLRLIDASAIQDRANHPAPASWDRRTRTAGWAAGLLACAALAGGPAVSADDGPAIDIHDLPNRPALPSYGSGLAHDHGNQFWLVTDANPPDQPKRLVRAKIHSHEKGEILEELTLTENGVILTGRMIDLEDVSVAADGSFWSCDESGPWLAHITRTGELTRIAAPANLAARANNQGLEGCALGADGTKLYAVLQSALTTEPDKRNTIVLVYDLASGAFQQHVYRLDRAADYPYAPGRGPDENGNDRVQNEVNVRDLPSGTTRELGCAESQFVLDDDDDLVLLAPDGALVRRRLSDGHDDVIAEAPVDEFELSEDRRRVAYRAAGAMWTRPIAGGAPTRLGADERWWDLVRLHRDVVVYDRGGRRLSVAPVSGAPAIELGEVTLLEPEDDDDVLLALRGTELIALPLPASKPPRTIAYPVTRARMIGPRQVALLQGSALQVVAIDSDAAVVSRSVLEGTATAFAVHEGWYAASIETPRGHELVIGPLGEP